MYCDKTYKYFQPLHNMFTVNQFWKRLSFDIKIEERDLWERVVSLNTVLFFQIIAKYDVTAFYANTM